MANTTQHDPERPFSHSALLTIKNYGEMTERDRDLRRQFVARAYGLYDRREDMPFVVALSNTMEVATDMARARRYTQYLGNMVLQGMYDNGKNADHVNHHLAHVQTGDMLPHLRGFYDIALDRLTAKTPDQKSPEYLTAPKPEQGISAELGHVDMYGVWSAAERLDQAVNSLTTQENLGKVGLRLVERYTKDDPRTRYVFAWAPVDVDFSMSYDQGDEVHKPSTEHPMIIGFRKRPVADVVSDDFPDQPIEIVKRSSFLIVPQMLEAAQMAAIVDSMENKSDKELAKTIGNDVIEPILASGQRNYQLTLSPVSALYFARMRTQRKNAN